MFKPGIGIMLGLFCVDMSGKGFLAAGFQQVMKQGEWAEEEHVEGVNGCISAKSCFKKKNKTFVSYKKISTFASRLLSKKDKQLIHSVLNSPLSEAVGSW